MSPETDPVPLTEAEPIKKPKQVSPVSLFWAGDQRYDIQMVKGTPDEPPVIIKTTEEGVPLPAEEQTPPTPEPPAYPDSGQRPPAGDGNMMRQGTGGKRPRR